MALVASVQMGLLAAFSARDDRKAARAAWITGVALGLGILTKSLPAFINRPGRKSHRRRTGAPS